MDRVAAGNGVAKSIRTLGKEGQPVPAVSVFWCWLRDSVELQETLARARDIGVEANIDIAIDILDGVDLERDENGQLKNPDEAYLMDVKRARARAQVRLDYAKMMKPVKYGAKLDVTSGGGKLHDPKTDAAGAVIDILAAVATRIEGTDRDADEALPTTLQDLLS